MILKSNIILSITALWLFVLLSGCDNPPQAKKQQTSNVVSKKISQPVAKQKQDKPKEIKKTEPSKSVSPNKDKVVDANLKSLVQNNKVQDKKAIKAEHYDSKGKIDPFKPLIQDKTEKSVTASKLPKRILTPLEKIELSQIRLVAVIIMKDRQIAMVEEASGKGYEVGIGTFMGKNQGRVSEIKNNSIVVKELVKDFKGRIKEKFQEIKLHKNDSEE